MQSLAFWESWRLLLWHWPLQGEAMLKTVGTLHIVQSHVEVNSIPPHGQISAEAR
jgi:hypothetical protein